MDDTTTDTTGQPPATDETLVDPAPVAATALDKRIAATFPGVVVRKDLVKAVKGNAIVPTYVLEYLLGQYAATDDEATIRSGIDSVRAVLRDHYVHRDENRLVQSKIREKGRHRVIDKVSVALNEKLDLYEAEFSNLGIKHVIVSSDIVRQHEKLLTGGVWCICDIVYAHSGDPKDVPWLLQTLKPIQLSHLDLDEYKTKRAQFTTDEWIDMLIQSIGFDPDMFGTRAKLLHLVRLIPFVERNYNLVELGPKGTGKSHIYSEFSPHGMLISGGEVTVAKLFVNNANGRIGLVGYWDCVAFDEFAGKKKRADRALVDIMKNYMANKSFSRGVEPLGAQASMVFIGNTGHTVPYMLQHADLFDELPEQYHDPAFLDRIHFYIPGWEFEQIRGEMFSAGCGFVVDYLAEVLKSMRDLDYSDLYESHVELSADISTRDLDGIRKTFSGLMKLVHPNGQATPEEIETLLVAAMEGRKRVKDQLIRIDTTMTPVRFAYRKAGDWHDVTTLEELEYPELYAREARQPATSNEPAPELPSTSTDGAHAVQAKVALQQVEPAPTAAVTSSTPQEPQAGQQSIRDGQRNVTYDKLFGPWLRGATDITIVDPFIRAPYQVRNLMEFMETIIKATSRADEVHVHLVTGRDDDPLYVKNQLENLEKVKANVAPAGIVFDYEISETGHDRWIDIDTGWRIVLGRGLDIYQKFADGWLDMPLRQQALRQTREFQVTYIHNDSQGDGINV